ncbi:MAG: alpha-amylase family glycosyl hydrolase, partial [Syntrophales bacterium]|nr:alpha-amylase family glycosyl hydrolase [Syntrophales bacterium]
MDKTDAMKVMNSSGNLDQTWSFLPFPVPELKSRNMRIGPRGILKRSFAKGLDDFFRIYEGEYLNLHVEIQADEYHNALVHLYTNIDAPDGEWRELEFTRDSGGVHRLSYQVNRRGNYQFKMKYSLDGGDNWYWDRLSFSRVIVDKVSLKDIRMYTLIPTVSGTMKDWTDALVRIADLGFNSLHLLPITELDVSESPYSARDFFSIDGAYIGGAEDPAFSEFRRFVEAARETGIRLCFDLTLNHVGVASNIVERCPEWITPDRKEKDGMKRAGCWHMNTWLRWEDLVRIYYDHPHPEIQADIWDYMTKYSLFWAHFANLTGGMVRLDNLHSSHEGFIGHLMKELRDAFPDLIV